MEGHAVSSGLSQKQPGKLPATKQLLRPGLPPASNVLSQKQPGKLPAKKQFQKSVPPPVAVSKKMFETKIHPFSFKKISFLRGVAIRVIFLMVAISCFMGYSQQLGNRFMKPVFEYDQQYLEKTLKNLGGSLFLLAVPKGVLEVTQTLELEPTAVTIKVGSAVVGRIVEPLKDIVDDIWDFLVLSTYLVLAQFAVIKLTSLISIKFFLGLGALFCAIQYNRKSVFGKIGLILIFLFVMTYVFYPLTLGMAAKTYEQHQIETSIQLSENLGILKEQASDLDLSVSHLKDTIKSIPQILGQGLRTAWESTLGLLVGLILMFVMLPLLTLGTIYLIGRQTLLYIDSPVIARKIDSASQQVINKVGLRSRSKLAISKG